MRVEWEERKRQENIARHGVDFGDVFAVFLGPMLVRLDTRYGYGEDRWVGVGLLRSRVVVVVYVEREEGETIRLISARKATSYERQEFHRRIGDGLGPAGRDG
jgi:uncharacterized DUF497 family protein